MELTDARESCPRLAMLLHAVWYAGCIGAVSYTHLIGDRAGNVVLAELVAALEVIYGIRTPFNLKKMNELARFAAQVSAREIPVNAPIVGDHVFVDQDDYHIDGSLHDPCLLYTSSFS